MTGKAWSQVILGNWRRRSWGGGGMRDARSGMGRTPEVRFKKNRKQAEWLCEEGSRKTIGPEQ